MLIKLETNKKKPQKNKQSLPFQSAQFNPSSSCCFSHLFQQAPVFFKSPCGEKAGPKEIRSGDDHHRHHLASFDLYVRIMMGNDEEGEMVGESVHRWGNGRTDHYSRINAPSNCKLLSHTQTHLFAAEHQLACLCNVHPFMAIPFMSKMNGFYFHFWAILIYNFGFFYFIYFYIFFLNY